MNYKYFKVTSFSLIIMLGLNACGILPSLDEVVPDNTKKYRQAETMPELEIPPELSSSRINDDIVGSTTSTATYSEFEEAKTNPLADKYNITPETKPALSGENTTRHLIVPGSREVVWQRLSDFWIEQGVDIKRQDERIGLMDTETGIEDYSYRVRVERGDTLKQSLVYVGSMRPDNNNQRNEAMLRQIAEFVGAIHQEEQAEIKEQKKVQPQISNVKATIVESSGGKSIFVVQDFADTWEHVGRILDSKGFSVEERDRSRGTYFVQYIDPESAAETEEKEEGMLSKLAFWRDSTEKAIAAGEYYNIKLISDASNTKILMLDAEGDRSSSLTANKLLTLLQEQLVK